MIRPNPNTTAYAPIQNTIASAPATGANRMSTPNASDKTPITINSHSFNIAFRSRMPATISNTPVKIAQNAIKYRRTIVVIADQANVRTPTIIPTIPSMRSAQ